RIKAPSPATAIRRRAVTT
ncbi:hypothetical protein A2U01_0115839, partial [Trifolium medium]|nr:hypothetical protein [Trifolium medium]